MRLENGDPGVMASEMQRGRGEGTEEGEGEGVLIEGVSLPV